MKRRKDLQEIKSKKLGVCFGAGNPDHYNFAQCFDHIDDILKVLADELDQQLRDQHMDYKMEWGDKETLFLEASGQTEEDRKLFIDLLISDALSASIERATGKVFTDPWSRIKGFMALRLSKEDVESPIRAEEYETIKEIAIEAERQKPINLESIPVNMQRPEWTEAEQMELLMKKEKDEFA